MAGAGGPSACGCYRRHLRVVAERTAGISPLSTSDARSPGRHVALATHCHANGCAGASRSSDRRARRNGERGPPLRALRSMAARRCRTEEPIEMTARRTRSERPVMVLHSCHSDRSDSSVTLEKPGGHLSVPKFVFVTGGVTPLSEASPRLRRTHPLRARALCRVAQDGSLPQRRPGTMSPISTARSS